jgi:two-component system cell cycle response regulator
MRARPERPEWAQNCTRLPGTLLACVSAMRALIADDDPVTTAILSQALQRMGIDVISAHDGASAWRVLTSAPAPELAIVDWMMPGIDGIEICRRVRLEPALAGTYVLLLTGRGTRADLVEGLDSGADDYMIKPIDAEELRARVQVGLRVANLQGRLAEQVNQLQVARDRLARLVSTDVLTDLFSRRWWFELAATEFSRCRRYDRGFSLMVIDLDLFKGVNDAFGHDAGDKLLRAFADMLRAECRQSDIVGRLGGEEFAVLVPETRLAAAQQMAGRLLEACRAVAASAGDREVRCTCSIGVSELGEGDDNVEEVLRRADAALYEAKRSGRDCWKGHDAPVKSPLIASVA